MLRLIGQIESGQAAPNDVHGLPCQITAVNRRTPVGIEQSPPPPEVQVSGEPVRNGGRAPPASMRRDGSADKSSLQGRSCHSG
jgi:hypothetical protein